MLRKKIIEGKNFQNLIQVGNRKNFGFLHGLASLSGNNGDSGIQRQATLQCPIFRWFSSQSKQTMSKYNPVQAHGIAV